MNCYSGKVCFKTEEDAVKHGFRAYKCLWCKYWHRTGKVTEIQNPVLKKEVGK